MLQIVYLEIQLQRKSPIARHDLRFSRTRPHLHLIVLEYYALGHRFFLLNYAPRIQKDVRSSPTFVRGWTGGRRDVSTSLWLLRRVLQISAWTARVQGCCSLEITTMRNGTIRFYMMATVTVHEQVRNTRLTVILCLATTASQCRHILASSQDESHRGSIQFLQFHGSGYAPASQRWCEL